MKPTGQSFVCYADADFANNWCPKKAGWDNDTSKSRTGYIILYTGCPVVWASKLQTETVLSTTEAEYVALSQALQEVIPLMSVIKELKTANIFDAGTIPEVRCTLFEDNKGARELATVHNTDPAQNISIISITISGTQ